MLNNTFEAGMCMKTKDRKTQCPKENRLIVPRFRHLRRIERYFAGNCCFYTTNCQTHSASYRFYRACYDPYLRSRLRGAESSSGSPRSVNIRGIPSVSRSELLGYSVRRKL